MELQRAVVAVGEVMVIEVLLSDLDVQISGGNGEEQMQVQLYLKEVGGVFYGTVP